MRRGRKEIIGGTYKPAIEPVTRLLSPPESTGPPHGTWCFLFALSRSSPGYSRSASVRMDSWNSATFGSGPGRGTTTQSIPGRRSRRIRRNASRSSRLIRLRRTAVPKRRPTEMPSRLLRPAFGEAYRVIRPSEARRPSRNARRKLVLPRTRAERGNVSRLGGTMGALYALVADCRRRGNPLS